MTFLRVALPLLGLALTVMLDVRAETSQQAEIQALVNELDYLIEYSEQLAQRYREDDAPIRFNYAALLAQLRTTRARTAAYLNEQHRLVHPAPPGTVDRSLTRRR
ncbi:MAG: hypothetical protein KDK04_24425 [Candidatus Competibacteraceae bacterium]|nr:hypothetical protein [Candidatus Competibacteraceae bacterium]MCB1805067.1 hypothetical protein [Candidatus Competibacteraceae bacterium]MCB1814837.1 hypothetical protein [Candidatus Competibacteraceae bacterium]